MTAPEPKSRRPIPGRLRLTGIFFLLAIAIIVTYGMVSRAAQNSSLHQLTEEEALPTVAVVMPQRAGEGSALDLPGRLDAYISAPIYARVPGYLKSWNYDIGRRVKAGAVLAVIDTPDLDQQLMQARADLNVAKANAKLAQISAARWQALAGTDAVAKQDVDQRTYAYNAAVAQVNASQANVDRLAAEEGFKRLVAPFDGIVTARQTDIGALIDAGGSGGAALFVVSAINKLRVYVSVPQNDVPSVPPGTRATISVPEHPGTLFSGTVETSAQSVNPTSGTTLMEIIVDNGDGQMMPGDYASTHLQVASIGNVLSVPSSALIFNAEGLWVATVGTDNRVLLKKVAIARDLGPAVELSSGLSPEDRVVENPPDGVNTGDEVRVVGSAVGSTSPGGSKSGDEKD
ncbi:MAG TPA: efflux RND transporter periplasmic adaptor subunit [Steroidobacteraceae bacterium]|nr:efflux RND transporter periplasmic adaptor subunit [Steroidobacteraceae bacterium]